MRQATGFRSNPHWKGEEPPSRPARQSRTRSNFSSSASTPGPFPGQQDATPLPSPPPSGAADERRPSRPHVGDEGVELSEQTRRGPAITYPRKDGLDKIHPNQSQHFFLMVGGKKNLQLGNRLKDAHVPSQKPHWRLCGAYPRVLALMTYYPEMIRYLITPVRADVSFRKLIATKRNSDVALRTNDACSGQKARVSRPKGH